MPHPNKQTTKFQRYLQEGLIFLRGKIKRWQFVAINMRMGFSNNLGSVRDSINIGSGSNRAFDRSFIKSSRLGKASRVTDIKLRLYAIA